MEEVWPILDLMSYIRTDRLVMAKLTVWEHLSFSVLSLMWHADSMFTIRARVCVELAVSCSSCAVISAVYWPSDDSTWVSFLLSMNTPGTCVTVIFHNVYEMYEHTIAATVSGQWWILELSGVWVSGHCSIYRYFCTYTLTGRLCCCQRQKNDFAESL